ncbi:unnamed protein product [Trichogramma brassicae]|uniref:Uncharacterized protein n=1 Tax=Trichogramma brassicae TaxID=86971 RepID=A0A6H5I8Q7_9HYME|nr:unnamed protein product [Trichogramma brassicae]
MHKAYTKAEKKRRGRCKLLPPPRKKERLVFLRQLDTLISHWEGPLPNLLDVFSREQVESLLLDSICYMDDEASCARGGRFIEFVARSGYKAEPPQLDADGKPVSRYTTPLHVAAKYEYHQLIDHLFRIYDRVDANRSDESGLTHFHVACQFGCEDVVQKHLDLGLDPNLPVRETGDSPLHLALANYENETAAFLLRNGADANLANGLGQTPLHVICNGNYNDDLLEIFINVNYKFQRIVRVDARDKLGNTPLHLALELGHCVRRRALELLLKNGADPNLAKRNGSTALHIIAERAEDDGDSLQLLFDICDEKRRPVHIDAWDKKGNTALHLALLRENKNVVRVLLRNGADPFVANEEGVIPLHFMYRSHDYDVEEMFYKLGSSSSSNDEYESVGSKIRDTVEVAGGWPQQGLDTRLLLRG